MPSTRLIGYWLDLARSAALLALMRVVVALVAAGDQAGDGFGDRGRVRRPRPAVRWHQVR
jgi:hypothetical protein